MTDHSRSTLRDGYDNNSDSPSDSSSAAGSRSDSVTSLIEGDPPTFRALAKGQGPEFEIRSTADDAIGTYYGLAEDAPCSAVIVDEVDGLIRFDGMDRSEGILRVTKELLRERALELRNHGIGPSEALREQIQEFQDNEMITAQEAGWLQEEVKEVVQDLEASQGGEC